MGIEARAGKTSFIEYIQHALFLDERETRKTHEVVRSARFDVALGKDRSLELVVKTIVDVPGQVGPVAHADLVFDYRPHAVVILLDLTRPLDGESDRASAAWLTEFCRRLEAKWRASGRRNMGLKTMIVVMNKADKCKKGVEARYRKRFQKIADAELKDARGGMLADVAILPCVLVTNPEGTTSVDAVIALLAKDLTT